MCDNDGHVCPKVTHVFKNCRFYQCVSNMLYQIPDRLLCEKTETQKSFLDSAPKSVILKLLTYGIYKGGNR